MSRIIVLFVLFLLPFGILQSQFSDDLTFDVKPFEKDYLRYFIISNEFDSSKIELEIGELRLSTGANTQKLVFQSTFDETKEFQGDSIQGEDLSLRAKIKTNQFILPANTQLKFFRRLTAFIPYDIEITTPEEPDQGGDGTWRDKWWLVGKGTILDKSEFVLQLVRASDNLVIAVLDSVGVDTNPNSNLAQRYGINPTQMNHVVNLPSAYANTDCYIRLSPRRWGPTPYGMRLNVSKSWVSSSEFMEYDSLDWFKYVDDKTNEIDSLYLMQIIDYCDSIKQVTGWLPNVSGLGFWTERSDSIFSYRYYNLDTVLINNEYKEIWVEKRDTSFDKSSENELTNKNEVINKPLIFGSIKNPLGRDESISVEIISNSNSSRSEIMIYSTNGAKLQSIQTGKLYKGKNSIKFGSSKLTSGIFLFYLFDELGNLCDTRKIIVN